MDHSRQFWFCATMVLLASSIAAPEGRTPHASESKQLADKVNVENAQDFWAFRPPQPQTVPVGQNSTWARTDIDRFIAAGHERRNLLPAADADRRILFRRAHFDLTGLPPELHASDAFVDDPDPHAFEKLVDRLLASPEFGEHWGRHWLDVARFAESSGGGRSLMLPDAWRYRDYVIAAFNADKPYDRFVTEQIAGDLLPHATLRQRDEQYIATGYLVLGPTNYELQDKQLLRMEVVDEQLDTIGRSFLGLTIGCARCHDHKFDPIPTRDYYALAGIFRSTQTLTPGNVSRWIKRTLVHTPSQRAAVKSYESELESLQSQLQDAKKALAELASKKSNAGSDAQSYIDELNSQLRELEENAPPPLPTAMSVVDIEDPEDCKIHVDGEVRNLGPSVPRGFLSALAGGELPVVAQIPSGRSGRLRVAAWLTHRRNPLTARVMVNRIWQHLLGAGLVRTSDNFGFAGENPSHPELLDYLALRFIESGWSVKQLVREIMLSSVYGLSTNADDVADDPENRLLYRAHRKPLSAENLRDAILTVSGRLDRKRGSLTIREITHYDVGYEFDTRRRSVYVPYFRNARPALFEVFDAANPNVVTGQRSVTTLPTQALYMFNSEFVMEEAHYAASRLLARYDVNPDVRLETAYRWALGRPPSEVERRISEQFLYPSPPLEAPSSELERWTRFVHTLFASVDFRYLN